MYYRVYNVGIQVTPGRGRYRDTNVVTFAPRFEIDNQSQWKLAIAQKHLTQKEVLYLLACPVTRSFTVAA